MPEKTFYLEEFLDKLSKMVDSSETEEQLQVCVNYINQYKLQLNNTIKNDIFRNMTNRYLDIISADILTKTLTPKRKNKRNLKK